MQKPIISADSHVTEPPDTYISRIDPKYRDVAPRMVHHEELGDTFLIDGMKTPVPMGLVAAAGKRAEELRMGGVRFEEIIRALNDIGYDGPLSVEWEDSGMDREAGAEEAAQYCRNVDFKPSARAFDAAFGD